MSVYVDDIKLVLHETDINPIWKMFIKDVDLVEPTSFLDHVYVKGMYLAPHIHEHLRYTNGYGKLRTSSRTT